LREHFAAFKAMLHAIVEKMENESSPNTKVKNESSLNYTGHEELSPRPAGPETQ